MTARGLSASVIIAAAGQGRRFAAGDRAEPSAPTKVFALLAGRPILAHTLDRFAALAEVAEAIVAVPPDLVTWAAETFGSTLGPAADASARPRRLAFVAGGDDRTASVARALEATDPATDLVAIHDAARPLIRPAVVREALRVAAECGAAVVGRPIDHTIKNVPDGRRVERTIPRQGLWIAQTPQVFRRDVIARAYAAREQAGPHITDDAQLVEALGLPVTMVPGDAANFKITTPEDLRLCEALLAAGWPFED